MNGAGDDLADPRARLGAVLAHGSGRLSTDQARDWHARLQALRNDPSLAEEPRRFFDACGALPICGPARLDAARDCLDAGRLQAAELLLMRAGRDSEPDIRREANQLLAAVWREHGLEFEARELLASLALPQAGAIGDRERPPALLRVTVEQELCPGTCPHPAAGCECAALAGLLTANREFARGPGATLRLLDHGIQLLAAENRGLPAGQSPPAAELSERVVRLSVVDRLRLVPTAQVRLPPQAWRAGTIGRYDAGHLLPIADSEVHGLSLLEGRILWTTPVETPDGRDKPAIGPFGPDYCVIQAGGTLMCLDPADGRVRWQRTGFDYDAGLVSDDETGLIGDERAVVLFDADRLTYHVFDTLSGESLGTGVLDASPADLRKRRWNFGRRLLYSTAGTQEYRLRLWDPLTGDNMVDAVAAGRLLHHESAAEGLLTLLHGTRLTILSADSGRVLTVCELAAGDVEGVRGLSVLRDAERYYVHLERDVAHGRYGHLSGDVRVPHLSVEGLLVGIDRSTGEFWRRPLPRCNLLLLPQHELPILVCVSRIREGGQRQSSSLLVQVLDAATGELLAQREDLAKMSILHTRYDAEAGRVELAGVGGRIEIGLLPDSRR
jgi:hypothetical protein